MRRVFARAGGTTDLRRVLDGAGVRAKLMKLDPERTRHAINIAGVACAAMRQARVGELSHWKGVAFANAARQGVYSALLARAGMTGPAPIFEGQMGFEKELGVSLGNVGEKFETKAKRSDEGPAAMILNTSIKYWPAEYHSQSAIEAALFLRNQIGDPVESEIDDDREPRCLGGHHRERAGEMATGDARNSGSQPAVHHRDRVDRWRGDRQTIRPERFTDRRGLEFLENVKVERNDELSGMYPEAVANIVHVMLATGGG